MKLQHKLLAFSLGQIVVFGALFIVAGAFMRAVVLPRLHQELLEKTASAVRSMVEDVEVPLATSDEKAVERGVERHAAKADFLGLLVVNDRGREVFRIGEAIDLPALWARVAALRVDEAPDRVAAWAPVSFEGVALGSVAVAFGKARLNAVRRGMVLLAALIALVLFAAIGLSLKFSSDFVSPIRTMMEFSRQVAAGKFGERIEEPADAELRGLQRHLNEMTEALALRDQSLAQRQAELVASMEQLRRAQEELMHSTRLAAVGEIAGHTAHEVLNPITGIHGRVTRALETEERVSRANRRALRAVVDAWSVAYREGGLDGLATALAKPATGPDGAPRPIVEEDLEVLAALVEQLGRQAEDDARDWRFLLGEVERITRIIDNMRTLNRRVSTPRRLQVRDILREIVDICGHGAGKRNIRLHVEGDDATVYVDRHELVQVLTNLMRNAMQAIEEKSGRAGGAIVLRADAGPDLVAVRVRDDGAGIDPAHVDRLFEAGFTTRGARDGTGLGLSLSRRLARAFGGRLALESSRPGEGSTFLLEIPRAPAHDRSDQGRRDAA